VPTLGFSAKVDAQKCQTALLSQGSLAACQKSLLDRLRYKNPTLKSWIFRVLLNAKGAFCPLHTSPATLLSKVFHSFLTLCQTALLSQGSLFHYYFYYFL
jgi:hypothetical protein